MLIEVTSKLKKFGSLFVCNTQSQVSKKYVRSQEVSFCCIPNLTAQAKNDNSECVYLITKFEISLKCSQNRQILKETTKNCQVRTLKRHHHQLILDNNLASYLSRRVRIWSKRFCHKIKARR